MHTIGRLARKFGLSRSTLLYYDSIGLLKPSARTESEYRQYSGSDAKRLEQICRYRQAGLSLKEIANVLDSPGNTLTKALEKRLEELNDDIGRLREQQRFILGILKRRQYRRRIRVMNAEVWMSLLRASGFSDEDMLRWHVEFERLAPEKHREFLKFLCIPDEDIARIRSMGKGEPS
ncbi:MerR family transcriptional regulator [Candidatus Poribacteria bacterium]|nr:MerR family transcriptional regulator [Candidatus Poribacteria bacterium]